MDFNERCFTADDIARIADLQSSTVVDWTHRGIIYLADMAGLYTALDALQFSALHGLLAFGVPIDRAVESVREVQRLRGPELLFTYDRMKHPFFSEDASPLEMWASTQDLWPTEHVYVPHSLAGAWKATSVSANEVDDAYDIGPALRRALREISRSEKDAK